MDNQQKIMAANSIFQNSFLDCKAYYMYVTSGCPALPGLTR